MITDLAAPEGRPAPAAGWIKEFAVRDGAIWGRVEWTRHGAAAVTTREYRYISPVFEHSKDGVVMRLLRAALTNNPNLYLTAISSGATRRQNDGETEQASRPASDGSEGEFMEAFLGQLREVLGLADHASAADVMEAVRGIVVARAADDSDGSETKEFRAIESQGPVDLGRYVPVAHFHKAISELNALRAVHAREHAEHAVTEAMRAGKLTPAQREWAVAYCQADAEGFDEFIQRQPAMMLGEFAFAKSGGTELLGGGRRGSAAERAGAALTATELAVCSRLGLNPEEFMRRKVVRGDFATLNG